MHTPFSLLRSKRKKLCLAVAEQGTTVNNDGMPCDMACGIRGKEAHGCADVSRRCRLGKRNGRKGGIKFIRMHLIVL